MVSGDQGCMQSCLCHGWTWMTATAVSQIFLTPFRLPFILYPIAGGSEHQAGLLLPSPVCPSRWAGTQLVVQRPSSSNNKERKAIPAQFSSDLSDHEKQNWIWCSFVCLTLYWSKIDTKKNIHIICKFAAWWQLTKRTYLYKNTPEAFWPGPLLVTTSPRVTTILIPSSGD